jgi:GTPase
MNLPIITVITKIDLINDEDIYDIIEKLIYIYKSEKKGYNALLAKNNDDIVIFSRNLEEQILPIFLVFKI